MKHLTEEQKAKLRKEVRNFISLSVWGYDWEFGDDFDELLQSNLIETFIEPLINGQI
jgi:hypothetical protein